MSLFLFRNTKTLVTFDFQMFNSTNDYSLLTRQHFGSITRGNNSVAARKSLLIQRLILQTYNRHNVCKNNAALSTRTFILPQKNTNKMHQIKQRTSTVWTRRQRTSMILEIGSFQAVPTTVVAVKNTATVLNRRLRTSPHTEHATLHRGNRISISQLKDNAHEFLC